VADARRRLSPTATTSRPPSTPRLVDEHGDHADCEREVSAIPIPPVQLQSTCRASAQAGADELYSSVTCIAALQPCSHERIEAGPALAPLPTLVRATRICGDRSGFEPAMITGRICGTRRSSSFFATPFTGVQSPVRYAYSAVRLGRSSEPARCLRASPRHKNPLLSRN
jgi:hypothetical protein